MPVAAAATGGWISPAKTPGGQILYPVARREGGATTAPQGSLARKETGYIQCLFREVVPAFSVGPEGHQKVARGEMRNERNPWIAREPGCAPAGAREFVFGFRIWIQMVSDRVVDVSCAPAGALVSEA